MPIYSLFSFSFLGSTLVFILFLILSYHLGFWLTSFIPAGLIHFKKAQPNPNAPLRLLLSLTLSIVLWTGVGYLGGYLGFRQLSYGLIILAIYSLWKFGQPGWKVIKKTCQWIKKLDSTTKLIALVGIFAQLSGIIASGLRYSSGIIFHRLNAVDGVLHLAFAEFMKTNWPPVQPGAVGLEITNYHYWSDLYISEISRLFGIPVIHLYYQFTPIVVAVLLTMAIIILIKILGGNKIVQRWALFIHFFAGNLTFLFTLSLHKTWAWHTPAIDHGVLQFYNVPQAFARLGLLAGIISFYYFLKTKKTPWGIISVLLFASLFGFKVYFGIFAVVGVTLLLIKEFFIALFKTKHWKFFKKFVGVYALFGIVSLAIFYPTNKNAGGLFWAPMAWPKIMLGAQNIDWNEWWLRMQVYQAHHNVRNIMIMNTVAISIFLVAIYGTRLIGIIPPLNWFKDKLKTDIAILLWPGAILFTIAGMNTLQASGGANIFNFFIVALLVFGLGTAFRLAAWTKKLPQSIGIILTIIFVIISIPRPLQDLDLFLKSIVRNEFTFTLTPETEQAMLYLREQTPKNSIVQSHPENKQDYYETPYLAFFSQRQSYIGGHGILESHNQPIEDQLENLEQMFASTSSANLAQQMKDLKINYLYLQKESGQNLPADTATSSALKTVFENETVSLVTAN